MKVDYASDLTLIYRTVVVPHFPVDLRWGWRARELVSGNVLFTILRRQEIARKIVVWDLPKRCQTVHDQLQEYHSSLISIVRSHTAFATPFPVAFPTFFVNVNARAELVWRL